MAIAGGAAIALLFEARRTTRDIDALVLMPPSSHVRKLVQQVAAEVVLEAPGIRVRTLAPEQLLATKLAAWRDDVDIADAQTLLRLIPGNRGEVWDLLQPYIAPGRELKAKYALDDLWESRHD